MKANPSAPASMRLLAPLSGSIVPLEKVPDPVFVQRIVGDGVSIDPVSASVLAPCAGTVVHAHAAGHALTLRADNGLEVMIHVGIDTVGLRGEGFSLKVCAGERVSPGQELIVFDADRVAQRAKSLLTQVLVTNMEMVGSLSHASGSVVAGQDHVLDIALKAEAPGVPEASAAGARASSDAVVVPNPAGLHARPAAILAREAKRFRSTVHVFRGEAQANAKSVVSIMALNVKQGDKVIVRAEGPDAGAAVSELARLLEEGLHESAAPAAAPAAARAAERPEDPRILSGVCASPGMAVGSAFVLRRDDAEVPARGESPAIERASLESAREHAKAELEALERRLDAQGGRDKAAIFAVHRELLDDPDLLDIAEAALGKGASAAAAWRCAFTDYSGRLAGLNNELLAERACDIKDVGRRVLRLLAGGAPSPCAVPPDCIVLAEDLAPSDAAGLDREKVLGVCTAGGGPTSHAAILCRSWGLPALAAVEPRLLAVPDGAALILDADGGRLVTQPTPAEIESARAAGERARARRESEGAAAQGEARTRDGRRVRVEANIGAVDEAAGALALGAEGVGLCRSEFLFLGRDAAPSEDAQAEAYARLARAFPTDPVVVRVLDVGGDKVLPYLAMAREDNPFLGERGIRLLLERPGILRAQLRAILRASRETGGRLKVLFPMVGSLAEFRRAKAVLVEEAEALGAPLVPAGAMIEVPAAALMSAALAREADFFSLGTNDLTQYTLAIDRGNPKLAARLDALDPAVLRLIAAAVAGARAYKRPVALCGGAGGDLQAVPLLIGLGVDELSVSPPAVPAVKAAIRRAVLPACQELARKALAAESAAEVRALAAAAEVAS